MARSRGCVRVGQDGYGGGMYIGVGTLLIIIIIILLIILL
jgi:hypothetical protein